jgi:hypothetical protein
MHLVTLRGSFLELQLRGHVLINSLPRRGAMHARSSEDTIRHLFVVTVIPSFRINRYSSLHQGPYPQLGQES